MPSSDTPSKKTRQKKKPDFEKSLQRLEKIVDSLEEGELTLEQSLKFFEEGVALTRECQTELQNAEQTVKLLTEKSGEPHLEDASHLTDSETMDNDR